MMSWACTRRTAWTVAAGYVGLVMIFGLILGLYEDSSVGLWAAYLTYPGFVLVYILLALLGNSFDPSGEASVADPFGTMSVYAHGAVVNVLLVWAAVSFCRVVRSEWRR
ncbi:hypothetical protein [Streptomyces albipurpureus]|uniref:Integral membrane protein n=1 Tax=Streptomyces albipurpureus TaxID=2897419 RepID=A0ABT0UHB0_9ACTN|nr:hypothetical protein [Streptomyces sp. CWNU-1]MCM2387429.1 hypothetical protein [Streptomyces sp. CWNU-1]